MTPAKRSLRDFLIVEGSFVFVAAIPIAAVFSHRSYAPIALVMAVVAATKSAHWTGLAKLSARPVVIQSPRIALSAAIAAFAAWIAITGLWSPTPGAPLRALALAATALAIYVLAAEIGERGARDARLLAISFVASALLAVALLFFEAHSNGYLRLVTPPTDASPDRFRDITALGRGLAAVAPSLFPAAVLAVLLAGVRTRRLTLVLGVTAFFLVVLSAALELTIAANSAALLAGTIAALVATARPRFALTALTAIFVFVLACAPAIAFLPVDDIAARAADVLPLSWMQRLYVWRHAATEALACLPFGCGADYARSLAEAKEMFVIPGLGEPLRLVPLHPHNVFLQVWLELGLPGVALGAIAILAGGRMAIDASLSRPVAIALAGTAAATFVYWSVETSLWQEWRLAAIVIAAAGIAICANLSRARA